MPSPVDEWRARKAERCEDPLATAKGKAEAEHDNDGLDLAEVPLGPLVVASIGGKTVAKSRHTRTANRRYYFPLSDCSLEHFESSSKRWT